MTEDQNTNRNNFIIMTAIGMRIISLASQVLLMLTSDLDGTESRDRASLDAVLGALVSQLNMGSIDVATVSERTASKEVQLVVMRLLSKS